MSRNSCVECGSSVGGRLVEDRDARALHQHLGEAEPLAHAAARRCATRSRPTSGKPDPLHRLGEALRRSRGATGRRGGRYRRGCRAPTARRRSRPIGQIADPALDLERIAQRVEAGDLGAPLGRLGQPEQHQDRRRLARAVRPEYADDLAGADLEIDMVDRERRAVALGQPLRPDHHLAAIPSPRLNPPLPAAAGSDPMQTLALRQGRAAGGSRAMPSGQRRPKRATAKTTTSRAIAMMPIPTAPHRVEVSTVMRKLADSDSPPAALARIVVW